MAKIAYLRTIEDEVLDPYYITMDDYCYTLHEDLSKKKDKTYTKKLGLEPGQEFRIDVRKESGAISLLPLKK